MHVIDGRPIDGIDVSHWNGQPNAGILDELDWLKLYGAKACHVGGSKMVDGTDPLFTLHRRTARGIGARWRAWYIYLVSTVTAAEQVGLLSRTVGELEPGECVYLDWEDQTVGRKLFEQVAWFMDREFPGRWLTYVNDSTPDMTGWMAEPSTPIWHPDYSAVGLEKARAWEATVWQTGTSLVPGFTSVVPVDYVLRGDVLDQVCGL